MSAPTASQVLREFWFEVLNLDAVQPGDRLLNIGGDSLNATMIANRIELTWGFRPTMEQMLTCSFGELSEMCERRGSD
jgi:hypothetical protein